MSSIITLSELTAFMPTTTLNTPLATQVVTSLNQWVENRTNRCWGATKTVDERRDWAPIIWTYHQDVTAVSTITMGYPNLQTTVLDATSYFWNSYGRITMYLQNGREFNPSPVNNDLVLINYTYGVMNVPEDLQLAVLGIAAQFYNWAIAGNKDIVAASVGTFRLQYSGSVRGVGGGPDGNAPAAAVNTNQANFDIIESYRMRRT